MSAQKSDAATTANQWEKVRLRLANVAPIDGHAVITIKVYTVYGCPKVWLEPDVKSVEPKASAVIAALGA